MFDAPHRRRNPLNGKWILVSPHRLDRPWQGQTDDVQQWPPAYDPDCYLCPGNSRVTGERNPDYAGVHLFRNDFAALKTDIAADHTDDPLFQAETTTGECHVLCFSPDHGKTMPQLEPHEVEAIIACWTRLSAELGKRYDWVQIFENKGAMMGCSNPHPHGQVWATSHIPDELRVEEQHQAAYQEQHGRALLGDVARREAAAGERVVVENDDWLAVVPYWASWPFETLLLPKFAVQRMAELAPGRHAALADALIRLTARYDNLFRCSFPYSMGWHGAPNDLGDAPHWQLHAHFYPPLLRSATVRKFMVGYEMMAEAQRDLTPERAAAMLRDVGDVHFSRTGK